MHGDDCLDDAARLLDLPLELELPVTEPEPAAAQTQMAVRRVDALGEPGHDVLERPVRFERLAHRLEEQLDLGMRALAGADPIGDEVREAAVLDPEGLAALAAAVEEIDRAGDGGPMGRIERAVG